MDGVTQSAIFGTKAILKHVGYGIAFIIGTAGLPSESFQILAGLMVADTITGIIRVGRIHGWQSVRSSRLGAGVVSKMVIIGAPVVIAWAGKGAGIDLTPVASAALSILILSEAYSILGNMHATHIGKDVKEFDAVAYLLKATRGYFETLLRDGTKRNHDN
jgi:phage-related holin